MNPMDVLVEAMPVSVGIIAAIAVMELGQKVEKFVKKLPIKERVRTIGEQVSGLAKKIGKKQERGIDLYALAEQIRDSETKIKVLETLEKYEARINSILAAEKRGENV